ncbi:MAG: hypothetical protein A3H44_09995 [Gammaproteobacteria bacterium RIFCSPLOWO2_02_FULL_57_10]|nr:MAG: hypothetical protein A3H44_09995 [Gammaproteobacteria bacterium RIFCSPLOWO2_02_FULL_57_10]
MIEEKKTGAARTQPAVRDEFWTDERVQSFLAMEPPEGVPADYHILLKAYRGMLPDTFERFLTFFLEAERDINARLADGTTMLDHVSRHRKSGEYARLLEEAGATRSR